MQGQGPQPGQCKEQWQAFNNKLVKKGKLLLFLVVKEKTSGKVKKLLLWDGFTIFSALCCSAPAALAPRARWQPESGTIALSHCSTGPPPAFLSLSPHERGAAHRACHGWRVSRGPPIPAGRAGRAGSTRGLGTDAAMGFGASPGQEARSHLWR